MAIIASGNYPQNIEELSGQFEGDMVLTNDQMMLVQGIMDTIAHRSGLINEWYRWPNKTVPVTLHTGHFTAEHEAYIYKALRKIESASCVRFVNHTTEINYVELTVYILKYANIYHKPISKAIFNRAVQRKRMLL